VPDIDVVARDQRDGVETVVDDALWRLDAPARAIAVVIMQSAMNGKSSFEARRRWVFVSFMSCKTSPKRGDGQVFGKTRVIIDPCCSVRVSPSS
jgi:hypothetical protein